MPRVASDTATRGGGGSEDDDDDDDYDDDDDDDDDDNDVDTVTRGCGGSEDDGDDDDEDEDDGPTARLQSFGGGSGPRRKPGPRQHKPMKGWSEVGARRGGGGRRGRGGGGGGRRGRGGGGGRRGRGGGGGGEGGGGPILYSDEPKCRKLPSVVRLKIVPSSRVENQEVLAVEPQIVEEITFSN